MSLVTYGASSDEDSEIEEEIPQASVGEVKNAAQNKVAQSSSLTDLVKGAEVSENMTRTGNTTVEDKVEDEFLGRMPSSFQPEFLQKPVPRSATAIVGARNDSLRAARAKKGPGGKIQISMISSKDISDSDSDDDSSFKKRVTTGKVNEGRTGLLSLLPAPQAFTVKEGSKALIPKAVQRQAAQKKVMQRLINPTPTFSAESASTNISSHVPEPETFHPYIDHAEIEEPTEDVIAARIAALKGDVPSTSSSEPSDVYAYNDIPEQERIKLEGRRRGTKRQNNAELNMVEIDQSEQLRDVQLTMMKNMTTEDDEAAHAKPDKFGGPGVARNRNQITWLAHKALEKEFDLKNQWAENRATKRLSMNKYGF